MFNSVNSPGLPKSKKVEVLNFPEATTTDIVNKMDDILEDKPKSLIVHVGTNDLTNDVNLLNNVKKLSIKLKRNHLDDDYTARLLIRHTFMVFPGLSLVFRDLITFQWSTVIL